MRRRFLFLSSLVMVVTFYLLNQHLRQTQYPTMAPGQTQLIDALFVLMYALCAFVMIGVVAEYAIKRTKQGGTNYSAAAKRTTASNPRVTTTANSALVSMDKIREREARRSKEKVFY